MKTEKINVLLEMGFRSPSEEQRRYGVAETELVSRFYYVNNEFEEGLVYDTVSEELTFNSHTGDTGVILKVPLSGVNVTSEQDVMNALADGFKKYIKNYYFEEKK